MSGYGNVSCIFGSRSGSFIYRYYIYDEINEAIREAYDEGYFRKSVVGCPLRRENTKDNTPGIIYYKVTKGDKVKIKVMPKGFGSETVGYKNVKTC